MGVDGPALVIFHGGTAASEEERLVDRVRVAAARQTALRALDAGFESVFVATCEPAAFAAMPPSVIVDTDLAGAEFRFDERLRDLIQRYGLERPVVAGSGAVSLLGVKDLGALAAQLMEPGERFVTNNFFSGDLTGWSPGRAIARLGPFARDNMLPRRLRDEAGLLPVVLPRTTQTQFDIDTPSDLCVLALQPDLPGELRRSFDPAPLPLAPYREVMQLVCAPDRELIVAGRSGSQAWQYLERETACKVRFFSEERGMAAAGPKHRARSVLGYMLDDVGPERFFARMAEMGDALVLDTRVLAAHAGETPSRADRFRSDLLRTNDIANTFLRDLTAAAAAAPIPVLTGGHSLVAGGLMALNDAAWAEHDRLNAPG